MSPVSGALLYFLTFLRVLPWPAWVQSAGSASQSGHSRLKYLVLLAGVDIDGTLRQLELFVNDNSVSNNCRLLQSTVKFLSSGNNHVRVRRLRQSSQEIQAGVPRGAECREDLADHEVYVRQFR